MNFFLKILLSLAGPIITQFLLPLLKPNIKSTLDKVLPIAEHWVAAVETTKLPGAVKYKEAFDAIEAKLTEENITNVAEGIIDTAIQLAWLKLGLDQK